MIAAWLSFALIGAYELLMRQVRRGAAGDGHLLVTTKIAHSAKVRVRVRAGPFAVMGLLWDRRSGHPVPSGRLAKIAKDSF